MAVKKTKKAAKAAPAKKASAKASAAKKPTVKRVASAFNETPTKTQIKTEIAQNTGLSKKEVALVLDELGIVVERCVKKKGPGAFTLPGLLKIKVVHKPATKARKGVNPFTGEEQLFKAKPARNVIKIKALKKLKDMAA